MERNRGENGNHARGVLKGHVNNNREKKQMYSNKENINILTALLIKKGVTHAVVCPGSRNAPIVHNLNEADGITCHPVTD